MIARLAFYLKTRAFTVWSCAIPLTLAAMILAVGVKMARARPERLENGIYYPRGYTDRIRRLIDDSKGNPALVWNRSTAQIERRPAGLLQTVEANDAEWMRLSGFDQVLEETNRDLKDWDPLDPPENPGRVIWIKNDRLYVEEEPLGILLPARRVARSEPLKQIGESDSVHALVVAGSGLKLTVQPGLERKGLAHVPLWDRPRNFEMPPPDTRFYFLAGPKKSADYSAVLEWREKGKLSLQVRGDPKMKLYVNGEGPKKESLLKAGDLVAIERENRRAAFVIMSGGTISSQSLLVAAQMSATAAGEAPNTSIAILSAAPGAYYAVLEAQRALCPSPAIRQASLSGTLSPVLQAAVQQDLELMIPRLAGNTGDRRGEAASMTLLNALNGEVLAMASWPGPSTQIPSGLSRRARAAFQREQRRNGNFHPHVIGSAGKPLWVAAVWEQFPELRELTVNKKETVGGRIETTLGITFPAPWEGRKRGAFPELYPSELARQGRAMDRRWFFGHSTNSWFMDLMLLSTAYHPHAGGGSALEFGPIPSNPVVRKNVLTTRVGGKALAGAPRFDRPPLEGGVVDRFDDFPVTQKMSTIFDIEIKDTGSALVDLSVLEPMTSKMEIRDRRYFTLTTLAPERPRFDYTRIKSLYPDLTSHLLGGSAQLTNVKLAEAFARLGTGKRVRARFLKDGTSPTPAATENLPLSQGTLGLLRECMQGATEGGMMGDTTASRLAPLLKKWNQEMPPNGPFFRCYSKTGTAYVDDRDAASGTDTGNYAFCLSLETAQGQPIKAIAGAIFVKRRGSSIQTAVPVGERVFQTLKRLYFDAPATP